MVKKHIVCHIDNAGSVKFVYSTGRESSTIIPCEKIKACPSKLELKEYPKRYYKWAILQTYSEKVDRRDPSLKIDGIPNGGTLPNCHNDITVANSSIPFCWSSPQPPFFSDQPTYDCVEPGCIIFYTIFTKVTSVNPDFSACKYEFKFGLKWGVQMKDDKTINSRPIHKMSKKELKKNVERFSSEYSNGTFELNLIRWYKCRIIKFAKD